MPGLRVRSIAAAIDRPVDQKSSAETGAESQIEQARGFDRAKAVFGQRGCVGIDFDSKRAMEFSFEDGPQWHITPAGLMKRRDNAIESIDHNSFVCSARHFRS